MPKTAVATPYRGSIAPSSGICLWSYFSFLLTFFWFCSSQWPHRCLRPDSCPGLVIGPFEITTRWCTLLGIWLMIRVWQPSAYWSGSPWAIHESSLRSLSSSLGVFYFLAEKLGPRCFRNLQGYAGLWRSCCLCLVSRWLRLRATLGWSDDWKAAEAFLGDFWTYRWPGWSLNGHWCSFCLPVCCMELHWQQEPCCNRC